MSAPIKTPSKAPRVVCRFFAGRALNGVQKTDATFWHDGHKPLVPTRIYRWSWLAGWKRALIRVLVTAFTVLVAWTALFGSFLPELLRSVGWVTLPIWIVGAWLLLKQRQHRKTYRLPTAQVYADTFNVPVHVAVGQIEVPMNHIEDDESVTVIRLPETHVKSTAQDTALGMRFAKKLGIPDATVEIDHVGVPTLRLRCAPPPPQSVSYDDITKHLRDSTATNMICGLGRRARAVWLDWVKSPWIGLSFVTGMGKSTFCKLIAAQFLYWGGKVVIFDFAKEGESHGDWCLDEHGKTIPGVELHHSVETAHDALIWWNGERTRRSSAHRQRTGEVPQRTLVIIEEANISIDMLRDYWTSIRARVAKETGEPQPLRCPSVFALKGLACAGRSTLINGMVIAQKLSDAAAGGSAVRENLARIFLGNASARTFDNLWPGRRPRPRMSNHPGRVTSVDSNEVVEFQVADLTDAEAVEFAMSGQSQPVTVKASLVPTSQVEHTEFPSVPHGDDALGHEDDEPDTSPTVLNTDLVSLSQAVKEGVVGGSIFQVRQRRTRKPERFPAVREVRGKTFLYSRTDLTAWDMLWDMGDPSETEDAEEAGGTE